MYSFSESWILDKNIQKGVQAYQTEDSNDRPLVHFYQERGDGLPIYWVRALPSWKVRAQGQVFECSLRWFSNWFNTEGQILWSTSSLFVPIFKTDLMISFYNRYALCCLHSRQSINWIDQILSKCSQTSNLHQPNGASTVSNEWMKSSRLPVMKNVLTNSNLSKLICNRCSHQKTT